MKTQTITNNFKKIILMLLVFTAFSCSSDDNDEPAITIVETWRVSAITTETAYDLNNDSSETQDLLVELGCTVNQTLILKSDNTGSSKSSTIFTISEGSTAGTFEGFCSQISELTDDITWSQTQTSRTYTSTGGNNNTGTVTGTQLVFSNLSFPILDNMGDMIGTENIEITYTLQ